MGTPGSAATGTVMRESTLRKYADLARSGEVTSCRVPVAVGQPRGALANWRACATRRSALSHTSTSSSR
jgi:hypothetical protein